MAKDVTLIVLFSSAVILAISILIALLIVIWNSYPYPESYVITSITETVDDPLVECGDNEKITTMKKVNAPDIVKYECGVSGRVGQLITFYE